MVDLKVLKNREDWLEERHKRIGGSEAAAILGLNPYTTNEELWEIKTGRRKVEDISEKPYVQYGICAELYLREMFKLDFPQYEVRFAENNMFLNDEYPHAHASLDGWLEDQSGRKGVLEIKTTEIMNSTQKKLWIDHIPDNYYIQLLHYLMVTEFEFAMLKAQLKYSIDGGVYLQTRHYTIERAEVEEDIQFLAKKENEFWNMVESRQCPNLILPAI